MFRSVLPILLLLLLALPAGCGRKGPVRPLKQPLPDAPQDLVLRQQGMRFLLAWGLPAQNQDGSPLTDLEGFRIYKMKYDPAEDCPECRDTSILLEDVALDYLREVIRRGNRFYYYDTELRTDAGYQYRITPYDRKHREGAPAMVRLPTSVPPLAPATLNATGHDRLVRLNWEPVNEKRPDEEWLGYNLYRRQPGEAFPPAPVNHEPLTAASFEDFGLENDRTYIYAVRSLVRVSGHPVESDLSELVEVLPREGF